MHVNILLSSIDRKSLLTCYCCVCLRALEFVSMTKKPGFRPLTGAETRRLRRELKQGWSTVPPHAIDRARELAGVQPGKEHEFRLAYVPEQQDTSFIDY